MRIHKFSNVFGAYKNVAICGSEVMPPYTSEDNKKVTCKKCMYKLGMVIPRNSCDCEEEVYSEGCDNYGSLDNN